MADLKDIKLGDKLAVPSDWYRNTIKNAPKIKWQIWTVTRITEATLFCGIADGIQLRTEKAVRKKYGSIVGNSAPFSPRAIPATPEIIDEYKDACIKLRRYNKARNQTSDLIEQPFHWLDLNVDQLEALAKAWISIKAMAPKE